MPRFFEDFTVTWIIKNYFFFDIENGTFIISPIFFTKNIYKSRWRLGVEFQSDNSKKCISVRLLRFGSNADKAVTLDVGIEFCNSKNEVFYIMEKKKEIEFDRGDKYRLNGLLMEDLNEKMKGDSGDTLIVRCRMGATAESETVDEMLNRSCTIQTSQCLDELSYTREVSYSLSPDWSEKLTFSINESENLGVNIKARQDDILFEISREEGLTRQRIKCEITLLDDEGTEKLSGFDFFTFSEKLEKWRFPTFLKRSLLEKNCIFLNLRFKFSLSAKRMYLSNIVEGKEANLPFSPDVYKNISATKSLTGDLRKLLFSKEHADVSFCVDTEVISAHKNILASRSPVFSAMFHQQMAESDTGVIQTSDMDVQTLKLFLEFVYTGELEESDWERVLELLLAAEKYQVPSLKEKCSQLLKHRLSLDNVCDIISVADMVGEHSLKVAVMDYIKENNAEIFSSSKWSTFIKKNELCAEILNNFSDKLRAK